MKRLILTAMATMLVVAVGCAQSERGGGSVSRESFRITGPLTPTMMKPGETEIVRISLNRGRDFKDDVKVEIEAPEGLTVDPSAKEIKPTDDEKVEFKVTATEKAAAGEHTIKIKATPDKGTATSLDVKVRVTESGKKTTEGENKKS